MARNSDINEHDYLDLVEGRLPDGRADAVRAALRADPDLARKVKAMVADRQRMQEMSTEDQRSAPRGLVGDAVSRAERDTLLAPRAGREVSARARGSRIAALIAFALLLGAGITGSAIYLSSSPKNASSELAASAPRPQAGSPGGVFEVPAADVETRRSTPPLPDLLGATVSRQTSAAKSASRAPTAPQEESGGVPPPRYASSHDQVAQWNREVAEKIAGESSRASGSQSSPHERAPNATVGGMRLADAAKLAMEGRLRITTRPSAAATRLLGAQAGASFGAGAGRVVEQSSPTSFTVELTTRYDPDLGALQDAIGALAERLAGESFAGRTEVRLSAAPEGTSDAGRAIPSFRADDVLWWTRPPATWERSISVRAPVEVVAGSE